MDESPPNRLPDNSSADQRPDHPDFIRRALCYLENQISPADLQMLQRELQTEPAKQEVFIRLSLTRRGVIEIVRSRAKNKPAAESIQMQYSDAHRELSDTMVLPAISQASDEFEPPILPGPVSLPSYSPGQSPKFWNRTWVRAAGVLIPLIAGLSIWQANQKHPSASLPLASATPETPAPATLPAPQIAGLPQPAVPLSKPALASVTYSLAARWDAGNHQINTGSPLADGPHSLDSGLAQITLLGGATVVLQAPVKFEVTSLSSIRLIAGQVSAMVPHGSKGLSIQSPDTQITDLGTEFGMNVLPGKQTHVEVFVGQVRAETGAVGAGAGISTVVNADQAIAVRAGSAAIEADTPAPLGFVRSEELAARSANGGDAAMPRWLAFSRMLRQDPDLIAYYTFDKKPDDPAMLTNLAVAAPGKHEGTLGMPNVGTSVPEWSTGRWKDKGALLFGDGNSTAVVLHDDGSFLPSQNMSLAFWIKRAEPTTPVHLINRASGPKGTFNVSVVGTAGKPSSRLLPNSIYFNFGKGTEIAVPQSLPSDGQWTFLAITVDSGRMARFYIDGQLKGQMPMNNPRDPSDSGDIYVGRSCPTNTEAASGDIFRGWMDELALFHRVLSDLEVERMYEAGRP